MGPETDDEILPKFKNSDEEAKFWREKTKEYKQRLAETQAELEEYQASSGELEAELEAELGHSQAKCKELNHQLSRVTGEADMLKERLASQSSRLEKRVDTLEEELGEVRSIREGLTAYIRQLEQANDDLERSKRATITTIDDFEAKLNQAIERNAFLESELDEKEALKEMVQRLKDESRETGDILDVILYFFGCNLRQEVSVRQQITEPNRPDNDRAAANGILDSNKLDGARTLPNLTPSARVSALNIVGDLIRKVGALESRLASCRTLVKDNSLPAKGIVADPSAR